MSKITAKVSIKNKIIIYIGIGIFAASVSLYSGELYEPVQVTFYNMCSVPVVVECFNQKKSKLSTNIIKPYEGDLGEALEITNLCFQYFTFAVPQSSFFSYIHNEDYQVSPNILFPNLLDPWKIMFKGGNNNSQEPDVKISSTTAETFNVKSESHMKKQKGRMWKNAKGGAAEFRVKDYGVGWQKTSLNQKEWESNKYEISVIIYALKLTIPSNAIDDNVLFLFPWVLGPDDKINDFNPKMTHKTVEEILMGTRNGKIQYNNLVGILKLQLIYDVLRTSYTQYKTGMDFESLFPWAPPKWGTGETAED